MLATACNLDHDRALRERNAVSHPGTGKKDENASGAAVQALADMEAPRCAINGSVNLSTEECCCMVFDLVDDIFQIHLVR